MFVGDIARRWWKKIHIYKIPPILQKVRDSNKVYYIIYVQRKQASKVKMKDYYNNERVDDNW